MGCKGSKSSANSHKNLKFLLDNTRFDEDKINDLYNGFIEECPDGKLRKKFMEDVYRDLYQNGDPIAFSHYFFDSLDIKKKGFLTFTQFVMALQDLEGPPEAQFRLLFKVFDLNHNKSIDFKEMTKAIEAVDQLKGIDDDDDEDEQNSAQSKAIKVFESLSKPVNTKKKVGINEEEFVEACKNEEIFSIIKP